MISGCPVKYESKSILAMQHKLIRTEFILKGSRLPLRFDQYQRISVNAIRAGVLFPILSTPFESASMVKLDSHTSRIDVGMSLCKKWGGVSDLITDPRSSQLNTLMSTPVQAGRTHKAQS
jgi:hypothetical protein